MIPEVWARCPPWCVHRGAARGHQWHRGDAYDADGVLVGQVFTDGARGGLETVLYAQGMAAEDVLRLATGAGAGEAQ